MITEKRKQTIKLISAVTILVLLFLFVVIMMIKYEVEGEKNMPFKLSKIIAVGTVEGIEKEDNNKKEWDIDIYQNNDILFYIDKNEENAAEDELIKSVKISDIKITKAPQKGTIKTYMPNSKAGRPYVYDDQFVVQEKLEYKGGSQSSSTNLEIGSKGGSAKICFSNTNIGNYKSKKDTQLVHNSTLLKKINATNAEITFSVSFNFTIETTKAKYEANISLDLPTNNLDEEEKSYFEKTDMSDVVFKRVK